MTAQKKILFAGAGMAQIQAIRHAAELGYLPYVLDADGAAPGFAYALGGEVSDIRDSEAIIAYARKIRPDAIVAVSTDVSVPSVAEACRVLNLPAISVEAAFVSVDKLQQRNRLRAAGLDTPQYISFTSVAESEIAAATIGLPVVIKPTDSAGSRGVSLVVTPDQVCAAAEVALAASRSGTCLVEEFLVGSEISVEGFVVDGIFRIVCMSEKLRTPPPYLLDTAVYFPDVLPLDERDAVAEVATAAVAACGFDTCPVHMELLRTIRGAVVVELAARGPGFRVFSSVIPYVSGVDTINVQLQLALGGAPKIEPLARLRGAAIEFFAPVPGCLKRIDGLERARSVPGVQELEIYVKPGTRMGTLTCGADRVGHLIIFAETREEAEARAREVRSLIRFVVG